MHTTKLFKFNSSMHNFIILSSLILQQTSLSTRITVNSETDNSKNMLNAKIKLRKELATGVLKSKQQLMARKSLPSDRHYPNSRFTIEKWHAFRDFCFEKRLPNEEIDELDGCIFMCGSRLVEMEVEMGVERHVSFDSDLDETEVSHCKECFVTIPESYVQMPGGEFN